MDEESVKKLIDRLVIPKLDEFIKSDSAFFMYIFYREHDEGVKTFISPAPPIEVIEDVMRQVARRIHEEVSELPMLIVACEKVNYTNEPFDVDIVDSGLLIVAMDAMSASGFITLYSLPDMKEIRTKEFDSNSDDTPPYTMVALSTYMHETLIIEELIEKEEEDGEDSPRADVQFRFSRN